VVLDRTGDRPLLLCDLIARHQAFRAHPEKLGLPRGAGEHPAIREQLDLAAAIAGLIACGPRFVLGDDVIAAGVQALMSRPRSLRDCTSVLRVPWPVAFIEWHEPTRIAARRALGVARDNGQDIAVRCGFVVEADDAGRTGTARLCWSHREESMGGAEILNVSPIWFFFDFGILGTPFRQGDSIISQEQRRESDLFQKWARSPDDIEALVDMNRAFGQDGFGDAMRLATEQAKGSPSPEAAIQAMYENMLSDVAGEALSLVAILILMTSRNGTEAAPGEDRGKLNRARAKRGEAPLQDHVVVHMRLGRAAKQAPRPSSSDGHSGRASPRLHMVCGHPLPRGDAIYWRRAHARGLASGRAAADTRTVHVGL